MIVPSIDQVAASPVWAMAVRRARAGTDVGRKTLRKNFRMSAIRNVGTSSAAKWPPRSNSVYCTMLFSRLAHRRMVTSCVSETATPVGTRLRRFRLVASASCRLS